MRMSIVMPTLNEAARLRSFLEPLQSMRQLGHEIIVCDGGSDDDTRHIATPLADEVIVERPGRARQMNAGARRATGEAVIFLHADTRPPANFTQMIEAALAGGAHHWGRFDVRLDSDRPLLRLVGWLMNLRSRWTGIATGDQMLFVRRALFDRVGGFPDIALMEDIALSKTLKRYGTPACLRARVTTSARRWEAQGAWRTIFSMWRLRLRYWLGTDPKRLAAIYYGKR